MFSAGRKLREVISKVILEFSFIRGNFLLLITSWIIIDFFDEMSRTYYPLYVKALGGSAIALGLIGSVFMVTSALVQIPGGYLADKYGRKRLITRMTFIMALSQILYAIAPNWQTIMVAAVISGLCSIYSPALQAITMDSLPPERRGMGFSIINLITSVSTTPSPLIAAYLYEKLGLVPSVRLGFMLVFLALTIAGLLRLKLKETIVNSERISARELIDLYPKAIAESLRVWRHVHISALVLFFSEVGLRFSSAMIDPIILLYIVEDLQVDPVQWSYILTAFSISVIILSIPCGKMIDKIGKKVPLIISRILVAFVLPLIIYGNFTLLLFGVPLVGLSNILSYAATSALFTDFIPRPQRGKVAGSRNFFLLIAGSAGQLIGGILYDKLSHKLPFFIQYAFIIPITILMLLYIEEPEKKED